MAFPSSTPDVAMAQTQAHSNSHTHSLAFPHLRRRKPKSPRTTHRTSISSRPFAGRIGGNQEFTIDPDSSSFTSIISKVPDAAATFTWKQSFALNGFKDVELWKESLIEGVGTCLQIYLAGLYAVGSAPYTTATSLGPIAPATFGALANWALIALFIYAGGPVSGGHFNPLITLATFCGKLSVLPRTVLYIGFQCVGAVVSGWLLRASLGVGREGFVGAPGCFVDDGLVSPGQAYILETMSCFALVFIAFGVGLDPRQRQVLGPALSPILVGLSLAVCTWASGIARPGYSGASMNPARCLGLMSAAERFTYHYIHWVGPLTASVLNGLLYWLVPIYKHEHE